MTEAQLVARYRDIRARLYGAPARPVRIVPAISRERQGPPCPRLLEWDDGWKSIVNRVTLKTGITYAEMRSPSRKMHLMPARFETWYLIRMERGMSYPEIGRRFGRDNTTIYHGCCRWAEMNNLPGPR